MTALVRSSSKMKIILDDLRRWEKNKMNIEEFEIRADNLRNSIFDMGNVDSGMYSYGSINTSKITQDHFYPRKNVGRLLLRISSKLTNKQIYKILHCAMHVHTITKDEHRELNRYQKLYPYNWRKAYYFAGIYLKEGENYDCFDFDYIKNIHDNYDEEYKYSDKFEDIEIESDNDDEYDYDDDFIDNDKQEEDDEIEEDRTFLEDDDEYVPESEEEDSEEYNTYEESSDED